MHDPRVGRFFAIDPLAEHPKQVGKSPYSAFWNNPIRFNDPDGRCPECEENVKSPNEGQSYESKGGATYNYTDGQWSRQGGTLNEVVIRGKDNYEGTYFDRDNYGKGANPYSPSTDPKDVAMVYGIILSPIIGTMELGVLATAGIGMAFNATSQYAANGGNVGDINMIEAGMSGVPYIGSTGIAGQLAPTLIGETFSFTADSYKEGITIPNSLKKWGAQVGGGVLSFGFGKVTDNHLAGEKGGEAVGGFYKWLVETGSNAAPNGVK